MWISKAVIHCWCSQFVGKKYLFDTVTGNLVMQCDAVTGNLAWHST